VSWQAILLVAAVSAAFANILFAFLGRYHRLLAETSIAGRTVQAPDNPFGEYHTLHQDSDLSARQRVEIQLREQEQRYRRLFHDSNDGILVQDLRGNIVDVNEKALSLFGYTREEMLAIDVNKLHSPELRGRAVSLLDKVVKEGFVSFEIDLKRKSGESFPAEVSGSLVEVSGETLVQGIIRDITHRRQAILALRERDQRLRLMVEQLPAVLWTTDRDLKFTSSVGAGLAGLGLKPNEVVGKSLYEYFQNDDPEFVPIAMHRRALAGESVQYETEWEGNIFRSFTEPLRDEAGRIIGCLGIALDVTDRKKAERELQQSEKRMRALASRLQSVREEESASIAREIHDELGQELTVLKMDLRWIQRRIAKHDTVEECKVILDRLKAMSSDVDNTIESVRRIATKLRPVILDDLGLARAIEWHVQEFESRTGISVDLSIDRTRLDLGLEPSTAVFRILQEILTNIARHAGADRVTIAVVDTKDRLVMDVHDNGRGITNDEINSPRALGILGMQERAQFCGGELTVRRGRRGGTRVRVSVPLNRQSEGSTVVRSKGKHDV